MPTALEKAVSQVMLGMEPSRAASRYHVKVSHIREVLAAQERDPWGHTSLTTFVLRHSFRDAGKAIAKSKGEMA